jgi:hypothetical protein
MLHRLTIVTLALFGFATAAESVTITTACGAGSPPAATVNQQYQAIFNTVGCQQGGGGGGGFGGCTLIWNMLDATTGLPAQIPGLTIGSLTDTSGAITGTPTMAGTYTLTIQVTDFLGGDSDTVGPCTLSITVGSTNIPPQYGPYTYDWGTPTTSSPPNYRNDNPTTYTYGGTTYPNQSNDASTYLVPGGTDDGGSSSGGCFAAAGGGSALLWASPLIALLLLGLARRLR